MKLTPKLEVIKLPVEKVGHRDAERIFAKAVNHSNAFLQHLRALKHDYVNCCFDFYVARFGFEHGAWVTHCALFKDKISERTIQRRIEEAELMLRWAKYKFPELKTVREIREKFAELPLASVRGIVQEMRENDVARAFGEYYKDDYQEKKKQRQLGEGQMDFDFNAVESSLHMLCSLKVKLPGELEKVQELEGQIASAHIRIKKHLAALQGNSL